MDTQSNYEYMENFFSTTLAFVITAFISVIIGIYLEKFKARLVFLKYRLLFQPLATATQNDYWGNIEVLYNGRQTNHLNFITIEIKNDSNVDLQNVDVEIWVDNNSQILGQSGNYVEAGNAILLEPEYYNHFNQVIETHKQDTILKSQNPEHITPNDLINQIKWIFANKKFRLPIFNRHNSVKINIMVENFQGQIPLVTISVLHKSVKLIKEEDKAEKERKLGWSMILWGIFVYGIAVTLLLSHYPDAKIPLIITGIIGVLYLFFGLAIHKFIKFIKYLLS